MRVLLSTDGSRGDVEPMVGLAVRLRALGAEMPVCAPLVPVGQPVRPMVHAATPPSAAELPGRAAELVAAVAEGCDALVATGVMSTGMWQ